MSPWHTMLTTAVPHTLCLSAPCPTATAAAILGCARASGGQKQPPGWWGFGVWRERIQGHPGRAGARLPHLAVLAASPPPRPHLSTGRASRAPSARGFTGPEPEHSSARDAVCPGLRRAVCASVPLRSRWDPLRRVPAKEASPPTCNSKVPRHSAEAFANQRMRPAQPSSSEGPWWGKCTGRGGAASCRGQDDPPPS